MKHLNIKNAVLCLVAIWMIVITFSVVTLKLDNAHLKKQVSNHKNWITYFGYNVNSDAPIPQPKEVK